jgi:hypothetical protein
MALLTLPKTVQNVLVVGPIYNKLDKLDELERMLPQFDWIIINDHIASDDYNHHVVETSIKHRDKLLSTGKVVCNIGGEDLLYASKLDVLDPLQSKIESWLRCQPNVVLIDFGGSFRCLVMDGGVPPHITNIEQLTDNIEISFAPHPHQTYSGGLGYVVCNAPSTRWAPRFYNYSAQIGNVPAGQVYAFKMDRNGIRRTILV